MTAKGRESGRKPIETAAEFHRELRNRGLELRRGNGRDDAMIEALASKLGLPKTRFGSNLKASNATAEDYLRAMMSVAEPFARMFREIWSYLGRHCAPKASESILIRFHSEKGYEEIDLKQFHAMAQTSRRVLSFGPVLLWPDRAFFGLADRLARNIRGTPRRGYKKGNSMELAPIDIVETWDEVGSRAQNVLQSLIDDIHRVWSSDSARELGRATGEEFDDLSSRVIPELKLHQQDKELEPKQPERTAYDLAIALTDILPVWSAICENWKKIPVDDKKEAEDYFRKVVEPILLSENSVVIQRIQEALDLLELPFWRYRWHTYEVWASVKALEALSAFQPRPVIENGHILLDSANPAMVARLSARQTVFAHVQGETKLPSRIGSRRAIKPDLRFSEDDPVTNSGTFVVVEFKQRKELDPEHALEVLRAYSMGTRGDGGVVLINYDSIPALSVPPRCTFLGNVHPGNPHAVRDYQKAVLDYFQSAGITPIAAKRFVLLDVSGSMSAEYENDLSQRGLGRLRNMPWIKVFRFNDGLVADGDLRDETTIVTGGATQLGSALEQLYRSPEAGIPDQLLVVTDGGHDHPSELLAHAGEFCECRPSELLEHLAWLEQP